MSDGASRTLSTQEPQWIAAMKTRFYSVVLLLLPLGGCVSIGSNDLLFTPVGVVGVHHFAPERKAVDDGATDRREAAN